MDIKILRDRKYGKNYLLFSYEDQHTLFQIKKNELSKRRDINDICYYNFDVIDQFNIGVVEKARLQVIIHPIGFCSVSIIYIGNDSNQQEISSRVEKNIYDIRPISEAESNSIFSDPDSILTTIRWYYQQVLPNYFDI